jgi:hypothetical protein
MLTNRMDLSKNVRKVNQDIKRKAIQEYMPEEARKQKAGTRHNKSLAVDEYNSCRGKLMMKTFESFAMVLPAFRLFRVPAAPSSHKFGLPEEEEEEMITSPQPHQADEMT